MDRFAAIDFETATTERSSACAVGVAVFDNGTVTTATRRLIQPPGNEYDPFNQMVNGMGPEDTENSPPFEQVWPEVADIIGDAIVVAHATSFDLSVLRWSAHEAEYVPPPIRFVCSYRLAKRTFPNRYSYRLDELCADFGIDIDHHDPMSDAIGAGEVMVRILRQEDVSSIDALAEKLDVVVGALAGGDWTPHETYKGESMSKQMSALVAQGDGLDEDHPMFGRKVVFTGALSSMTRIEAAQKAVNVGAQVADNMSAKVDFLVVGETDYSKVGSDGMSAKLRKAVAMAESGKPLEIIGERDFMQMVTL